MSAFSPVFVPFRFSSQLGYEDQVYADYYRPSIPYGLPPQPVWYEYASASPPLTEYMWQCNRPPGISVGALREFSAHQRNSCMNKTYEKPSLSYVGLIAEAILRSPDKRLVLSDIYAFISENYPYFGTKGNGWRNSIRHNLSLNDCFVKAERSPNGKGHFWEINPLCYDELFNGTSRQRRKRALKPTIKKEQTLSCSSPKKEDSSLYTNDKLTLLSQLQYEDEIRKFEAASKKFIEDKVTPRREVCSCYEKH